MSAPTPDLVMADAASGRRGGRGAPAGPRGRRLLGPLSVVTVVLDVAIAGDRGAIAVVPIDPAVVP